MPQGKSPHLSLWPALGLGLSMAVCHGIGRFGYSLLLPAMREDLGWTYLLASWMNTANALGYVAGAVSGYVLIRSHSASRLFAGGLLMTVLSVAATGITSSFPWLLAVRVLSGVGAAWAFSCGGALVAARFEADPEVRGKAMGLYFGASGIGMMASGAVAPALLEFAGNSSWPVAWIVLGALAAVLAVWPLREARRSDAAMASGTRGQVSFKGLAAPLTAYVLFGISHPGYVFFIFAWTRTQDMSWQLGAGMWILLGLGVLVSPFLWQRALNRWHPMLVLSACCAASFAGSFVPVLSSNGVAVTISAAIFGASLFIAPSAAALFVRQSLTPDRWAKGIMIFTVFFSGGQALGSWGMGWIADQFSLVASLATGSAGLLLAALVALLGFRKARLDPLLPAMKTRPAD